MRSICMFAVTACVLLNGTLFAQTILPPTMGAKPAQPAQQIPKVPKGQWFDGEKGYIEGRELQEKTGANMILYFFRGDLKDEKGLCTWWERHGLQDGKVSKLLQEYVKVKMQLPFRTKEKDTFAPYQFNKTPAVYVVKPNGERTKIAVFDWPNNKPELKKGSELVDLIQKASAPKTAEGTSTESQYDSEKKSDY